MQIYFCERCGKRVSDVDLEKGHGVMIEELVYCDTCAGEEGFYEVASQTAQSQAPARRPSTRQFARRTTSRQKITAARRPVQQDQAAEVRGTPQWIYAAIFGSALLLVLALVFAFGGSGGRSQPQDGSLTETDASPGTAKEPDIPGAPEKPAVPEEPAAPDEPSESEEPASPAGASFALKAPPSALRPAGALVLADFDYISASIDSVSSPHQAQIQAIDGNQAVVLHKVKGDIRSGALLKLRFSRPLDLREHNVLSLYLVAGPEETEVSVGLNRSGSVRYLQTADGKDSVRVGSQWGQYDFVLSDQAADVYGVVIKFNAGGKQQAFTLGADEILAYHKEETLLAHTPSTAPSSSTPDAAQEPSWGKRVILGFEDPVDFYSKYEQPAEITSEISHSGDSCMRVRVEPGMKNSQSSRLIITLPEPVDFSRAAGFELFVKLEGIEENKGALAALGDDEEALPTDQRWSEWQFNYTSGGWQRIHFDMDTTAGLRSVHKVAVYFNYRENDGPFTFCLDDFALLEYVPAGKVLYSCDFESGEAGWKRGTVTDENASGGSQKALKAQLVEEGEYAVFPTLWYEYMPGNAPEIFTLGRNTFMQFDYLAKDLGEDRMKVFISGRDMGLQASKTFPLRTGDGKWHTLRVNLNELKPEGGAGGPGPGLQVHNLKLYAGKSGAAGASLFIDNILVEEVTPPAPVPSAWVNLVQGPTLESSGWGCQVFNQWGSECAVENGAIVKKADTEKGVRVVKEMEWADGEIAFDYDFTDGGSWSFQIVQLPHHDNQFTVQFDRRVAGEHSVRFVVDGTQCRTYFEGELQENWPFVVARPGKPFSNRVMLRMELYGPTGIAVSDIRYRKVTPGIPAKKAPDKAADKVEVIASWDFESGLEGWHADYSEIRKLDDGNSVLNVTGVESPDYFSRQSYVASWSWKPGSRYLFEHGADTRVELDYYVTNVAGSDEPLTLVVFGGTDPRTNYRYKVQPVVEGEWTHLSVPTSGLAAWVEGRPALKPGDPVTEFKVWAGNPGGDVTLMLDNVQIVRAGSKAPEAAGQEPQADSAAEARTASVSEPTKTTGVTGAEAIVLLFADFESGNNNWGGGKRVTDNTFNNSAGAYKANWKANAQFFPCDIGTDKWKQNKSKEEGFFVVGHDTKISFAYYMENANYIQLQFWNQAKNENFYIRRKTQQGVWTVMEFTFSKAESNNHDGKKTEPGDPIKSLALFSGDKNKETTFIVDNILIYEGDLPADRGAAIAGKIAETKAITGKPMEDGFYLNGEVLANLKTYYRKDKVEQKSVAVFGDDLANSGSFIAPMVRKGGELEQVSMAPRLTYAADRHPIVKLYGKLERGFRRGIPEVMVIMAGFSDITRYNLDVQMMEAEIKKVVEKTLAEGACPILVTLPRFPVRTDPFASKFGDWNQAVLKIAGEKRIPLIEAAITINRLEDSRKYFTSHGKLRRDAYEAINELFYKVYRALEYKVFERGEPLMETAPSPTEPGTGGQTPGEAGPDPEEVEEIQDIEI